MREFITTNAHLGKRGELVRVTKKQDYLKGKLFAIWGGRFKAGGKKEKRMSVKKKPGGEGKESFVRSASGSLSPLTDGKMVRFRLELKSSDFLH